MDDPSAQRIWASALGQLQLQVTPPNYDTWLKHTVGLGLDDGHFVVGTPSEFVSEWLKTRLRPVIAKTISGIIGQPLDVRFQIVGQNGHDADATHLPLAGGTAAQAVISSPPPRPRLNEKYTFQRFVVGDCNRLAAAAALAVADERDESYNPLFIYGSSGLGKTHLLQAIAHQASQRGRRVVCVTAEHFTNEFVTAIAQGRSDEFRRKYRSPGLLLIDDVHFLGGKERTQDEFFCTFNDLHSNGCRVVLTSDQPARGIHGLQRRLSSRLQMGLVTDLQPPDVEVRLAILHAKAVDQRIDLPAEVGYTLAERFPDNIRELEGALNRVVAYARLTRSPVSTELLPHALNALSPAAPACLPQADTIIATVSSYFNLSPQAIAGQSRTKPIAEGRHIAMYLLRQDAQLQLKEIGRLLGHRDHSTVIHACRKVSTALSSDPHLLLQLTEIRAHYR